MCARMLTGVVMSPSLAFSINGACLDSVGGSGFGCRPHIQRAQHHACQNLSVHYIKFVVECACSAVQEGQAGDGGMVYSWAQHRLCLYLGELRQHLPRISEGCVPARPAPNSSDVAHHMGYTEYVYIQIYAACFTGQA